MTHVVKTYTEKQIAFLKPLLDEAKGDIRAAMTIAGYAKTTKALKSLAHSKKRSQNGHR